MKTKTSLLTAAERLFDTHGFMATGMDRLAAAAGMSSRTVYKHVDGKTDLIVAVLEARVQRFFEAIEVMDVAGLFDALARWIAHEGARGCLMLRALEETGGEEARIVAAVHDYKARLGRHIAAIVEAELGRAEPALAGQLLILFEGATAASLYQGADAARTAGAAARLLVAAHAT